MKRKALFLILGGLLSLSATAQTPAKRLVVQSIDETKLVALHGNVHPLAQTRYDAGPADGSMLAGRLMLLLNRPADREAALDEYMQQVHTSGSPTYRQWLTPQQFGTRFGPADADIQQVSDWLSGEGFQVAGASKGRTLIEFSGTVRQVNRAFHTQIRKYSVKGELHYANATDPKIPKALAGIIREVSSLNDFRPAPQSHVVGTARLDPATGKISPDFTLPGQNGPFYAIAPQDFVTQYDLAPLYAAGVNGSGRTIGVINDSNIDVSLDTAYRGLFSLSTNPVQVVLDGGDPGLTGDAGEAYLDVELAGAIAPGATVDLYIASWDTVADALDDPLILAARRAIEDNQADVLSVSFGQCEGDIGAADNQILAALWEQAAAQGQTVLVSTGDSGSAGCDNPAQPRFEAVDGLAVNGFASTPWNVAVGGTDFYYSDYASGAGSAANVWNAANSANLGSLKAPLPEQVWNDAYGLNAVNPGDTNNYLYTIVAGGGGASGCISSVASAPGSALPFVCNPVSVGGKLYGYAKPGWQNVPGVPADGARDLPDLSLLAADGANLSAYAICANPGDCVPDSNQQVPLTLVGGTSASTQAMAGIMALVDQKYGRQGQANYTLYPLSRQKASAFHDITQGGNNVPCVYNAQLQSPDCVPSGNTSPPLQYTLSGYASTAGYDLASGLGSIDANVLVSNWNSLTFAPTSTSLQLSSMSFAHGTPVTVNTSVASSSGGAAPQGGVSILTSSPLPTSQSVVLLTLDSTGSATGSVNSLPGGIYQLWANYGGDGIHAASNSAPVSVTVTPEASAIGISASTTFSSSYNPATACTPIPGSTESPVASGSSVTLGVPLWLSVQPRGSTSNSATATGSVTFTLDGQAATVPLNVAGIATWVAPGTVGAGTHTVIATYSGDASYGASTSAPFAYTVAGYQPRVGLSPGGVWQSGTTYTAYVGDTYFVPVFLRGGNCVLPTGTITVTLGSQSQTVVLSPEGFPAGEVLTGVAAFPNLQTGTYPLSVAYSGDANYLAVPAGFSFTVVVTPAAGPRVSTTTVVSETSSVMTYGNGAVSFAATVTGGSGSSGPPTGYVYIYQSGEGLAAIQLTPSGPNASSGTSIPFQAPDPYNPIFDFGLNRMTGVYTGDSVYRESISAPVPLTVVSGTVSPDFAVVPQISQLTVKSGVSATVGVNLASVNEFSGAVALTCAPSSSQVSCSVNPTSVNVNGQTTATLTISAAAQSAGNAPPKPPGQSRWPVAPGILALGFLFMGGRAHRKLRRGVLLSLCLFAAMLTISCGGGNSTTPPPTTPPSPPTPTVAAYSVVVTGTADGIVHNAKINVIVP